MACITRHDRHHPRSRNFGHAVDSNSNPPSAHFIDSSLLMEVLVKGRATLEVIMREGHARRVEISSVPSGQAFDDIEAANVNKGHRRLRCWAVWCLTTQLSLKLP